MILGGNLSQELDQVRGFDEGYESGELWVEGEQVEDWTRLPCAVDIRSNEIYYMVVKKRLPCASVQWHSKVEGSPDSGV